MCAVQELERCHGQHHDPTEARRQLSGRSDGEADLLCADKSDYGEFLLSEVCTEILRDM